MVECSSALAVSREEEMVKDSTYRINSNVLNKLFASIF